MRNFCRQEMWTWFDLQAEAARQLQEHALAITEVTHAREVWTVRRGGRILGDAGRSVLRQHRLRDAITEGSDLAVLIKTDKPIAMTCADARAR